LIKQKNIFVIFLLSSEKALKNRVNKAKY